MQRPIYRCQHRRSITNNVQVDATHVLHVLHVLHVAVQALDMLDYKSCAQLLHLLLVGLLASDVRGCVGG
jgi:hypothetical protein